MKDRYTDRSTPLTFGVCLLGLGVLLAARSIWPGLLFVGGTAALIRAYYHRESRNTARLGVTLLLIGVWATVRFSVPILLVALGAWLILSAVAAPATIRKPYVDQTLD